MRRRRPAWLVLLGVWRCQGMSVFREPRGLRVKDGTMMQEKPQLLLWFKSRPCKDLCRSQHGMLGRRQAMIDQIRFLRVVLRSTHVGRVQAALSAVCGMA